MDLRHFLIVIVVAVVVIGCSFFLLNYDDSVHYQTVGLTNTSSIDLPISDQSTNTVVSEGIHVINDTKNEVTVMYFNSATGNKVAAVELEYIRNDFQAASVQQALGNNTVWYNEENNTYMAFIGNYNTHDNILIFSKDPEILDHMIGSVKYKIVDELGNTTETAYSDVNPTSSISDNGTENITGIDSTGTNAQSSSSTSVPSGYYWSGQDADYIKEYDDANGIHHIDRLNGANETYDPNTGQHFTNGVNDTEAFNQDFN